MSHAFLDAAAVTRDLLARPEVAARWTEPSSLAEMSVGALAHHLGSQVVSGARGLTDSAWSRSGEPVTLVEHYRRSAWVGADLDDDANVAIRRGSEQAAVDGPAAVLERVRTAMLSLTPWPADPPEAVSMPHWQWSMRAEDFLLTRTMEMVVHADDLAAGLGTATPVFPPSVTGPVYALLLSLAEDRYGQAAITRALTRRERAASIAVF